MSWPPVQVRTTEPVVMTATRDTQSEAASISIQKTDLVGNVTVCAFYS